MLTVGLRPGSVGNVPVTCRSDGTDVERQLLFSANSHYRPNPDLEQAQLDGGYILLSSYSPLDLKNL